MRLEVLLTLIFAYELIVFSAGYTLNFFPKLSYCRVSTKLSYCRISRRYGRFSPLRLCFVTKAKGMSSDNLEHCTGCDQQPEVQLQSWTESEPQSLFDAHCHLQLSDDDAGIDSLLSVHKIALMATRPDDWERTLRICERHPKR